MSSTLLEEPWPCQQSMELYVPMWRSTSGVQYRISLNDLLHNMPASRKAGRHTECSRASRTLDMSISAVHIRRLCDAASTFSPLRPPAIPLAVKSPYLNTILRAGSNGGDGGYLPGAYPVFWAGQTTGWTGFIRVDNTTYTWLGASDENDLSADQTAFEYTPTRSIFTLDVAGLVTMTVTFLSGVTPDDLVRSSLPYSYMDVQVLSKDGNEHTVQLYTDVSAGLLCPVSSRLLQLMVKQNGYLVTVERPHNGITLQMTPLVLLTTNFTASNSCSSRKRISRPIGVIGEVKSPLCECTGTPANRLPVDLGKVSTTAVGTLFQISLHQQNCIQFESALNAVDKLPCLWTSYNSTDTDALAFFYNDYETTASLTTSFDEKVKTDSVAAGGDDYYAITALATRQAFGALEFANTPTTPYLFLKEISSDGNIQTVDMIVSSLFSYPADPVNHRLAS
nr:glutaminase a [Quercus suber]